MIKPEGVKCLPACVVAAGYRNHNNGTVNNAGSNGNYWSSTVNGINSRNLNFNSDNANMNNNNRANGFSARCLKDYWESFLLRSREDFFICSIKLRLVMTCKFAIFCFLLVFSVLCRAESAWANLVIHSQTAVQIELTSYDSLTESSIFKGNLTADSKYEINTLYRGLALLVFAGGQRYPVIIGEESFTLKITDPGEPPSFVDSAENDFLYKSLTGGDPVPGHYDFALLMIQAQNLLESSQSIKTVKELSIKKQEFQEFARKHYESLKHSDMIKQLIAQYFMMHEYVDYHVAGAPATDIRAEYQKEIVGGVRNWLEILKTYIPEHEILNYCVSLYYNRSMVTLAFQIIEDFRDIAYCPGDEKQTFSFPDDLLISEVDGNKERKLNDFKGNKIIAFVSDDCPVSMVEAVSKVRQLADQKKDEVVIVAPLQELSVKHLAMRKMVRSGNMFFVSDEKWRKDNLAKKIKLPLFVQIGGDFD